MEGSAVQLTIASEHQLDTHSLSMRPVRYGDLQEYVRLLTEPSVMRYVGVKAGRIPSFEEIDGIVKGAVTGWTKRGWGRWTIFEKATSKFVGFTGFRSENGLPELISVVHEEFWGNGYAFEASRACIDYGYASLGFTEVEAYARPANDRARMLLERLGGQFEGLVVFHGVDAAKYLLPPVSAA